MDPGCWSNHWRLSGSVVVYGLLKTLLSSFLLIILAFLLGLVLYNVIPNFLRTNTSFIDFGFLSSGLKITAHSAIYC